jgi:hypothetical protein
MKVLLPGTTARVPCSRQVRTSRGSAGSRRRFFLVFFTVDVSFFFFGCARVLGVEPDRYVVATTAPDAGVAADSSDDVAEAAPPRPSDVADWSCLEKEKPETPHGTIPLHIFFNNAANANSAASFEGTPIAGAAIHWCKRLDLRCTTPSEDAITDDAGVARLNVPGGFEGYYEARADGFSPFIFARPPQLVSETFVGGIINGPAIALAGNVIGITQEAELSQGILTAVDCNTIPAPGVTFEIKGGPNARLVYISDSLPSKTATQTDRTGSAAVYNATPGTFEMTATIAESSTVIHKGSGLMRSGWVTFMESYVPQTKRLPLR